MSLRTLTPLPRRPAAVIFDLDGTLLDSERMLLDAHASTAARLGVHLDEARLRSLVGQSRPANDARLRDWLGPVPLEVYRAELAATVADRVAGLKPGVLELLDHLDAVGLPCALATSSGALWVERHLDAHGLRGRFRATVTREDVTRPKPAPEPYLLAAARLGQDPRDTLAIEDSPAGLRAAYDAGTMTVLVPDLLRPDEATCGLALWVLGSLVEVREGLGRDLFS